MSLGKYRMEGPRSRRQRPRAEAAAGLSYVVGDVTRLLSADLATFGRRNALS
jgi:hypothetical protein